MKKNNHYLLIGCKLITNMFIRKCNTKIMIFDEIRQLTKWIWYHTPTQHDKY